MAHDPTTHTDPEAATSGTSDTWAQTEQQQSPLNEAGQQATEEAERLAGRAADLGYDRADQGREKAADGISKVADTMRRVSNDMETDQPTIASAASTAADQAERLANYLRDTDARQLVDTIEDAARRQPLLFLGGAFVLGVAAARLIKAAGGDRPTTRGAYDWSSRSSSPYRAAVGGNSGGYRDGGA
jgi:hypothetical protein